MKTFERFSVVIMECFFELYEYFTQWNHAILKNYEDYQFRNVIII